MMRRLLNFRLLAWLVCLGLLAGVYFGEWIEVTRNGGYSGQAARNQYLAAEEFLGRFGVGVEFVDGLGLLDGLPPTSDALLIASSRKALSERRLESLRSWVRDGGRLLVLAGDYWDRGEGGSGDKLLDDIGIRLLEPEGDAGDLEVAHVPVPEDVMERLVNQRACGAGRDLARIQLPGSGQALTASMSTSAYLQLQGGGQPGYAENSVGPQIVYVALGDGAIIAFTSLRLWTNRQIHCHDHAHLLRWLTDDRQQLWWLFNTQMESLPRLIWRHFPVPVVLVVCWVGLWLWRSGKRLQRIPPTPDPARRELTEHLDGVARFYWQQGEGSRLLQPLRDAVLRGSAPTQQYIAALAERSGISEERIRWALTNSPGKDSRSFLAAARILHDLSKRNL